MALPLGPIFLPPQNASLSTANYTWQTLQNPNLLKAIKLTNKGPLDVLYSGFGVDGNAWIEAGTTIMLFASDLNSGRIGFAAITTTSLTFQAVNTPGTQTIDVTSGISITPTSILITQYYENENLPDYSGPVGLSYFNPPMVIQFEDHPNCANTVITLVDQSNLLGFCLSVGHATAVTGATLLISRLAPNNTGFTTLSYRMTTQTGAGSILVVNFPSPGLTNAPGTPIQFTVPTLSTASVDLNFWYTIVPQF